MKEELRQRALRRTDLRKQIQNGDARLILQMNPYVTVCMDRNLRDKNLEVSKQQIMDVR